MVKRASPGGNVESLRCVNCPFYSSCMCLICILSYLDLDMINSLKFARESIVSSFFNSLGSITSKYFFPELSFYLQWNDHTLNELHWIWWLNWPPFVQQQSMMLDADGGSLWPNGKLHICEHCSASFRSSYHLRRHVLIHTGTQDPTDWSIRLIFNLFVFLMKNCLEHFSHLQMKEVQYLCWIE